MKYICLLQKKWERGEYFSWVFYIFIFPLKDVNIKHQQSDHITVEETLVCINSVSLSFFFLKKEMEKDDNC